MQEDKLVSIIIPIYNEDRNIRPFYDKLRSVLQNLPYEFEIVFVDDGSQDSSLGLLHQLAEVDGRIKVIEFTRNFGKEIATTAGINHCRGEACLMIDGDLQHPVELIPEFLNKWEQGAEVVVGIRKKNRGEGIIKRVGSYFFYKLINAMSETRITPKATDYRLLDRVVIDEFNRFTEKNRMTRSLIDWLGFRREFVYFTANARSGGRAGYSTIKLIRLALSSFVAHSLFPLKFAGYLGIIITVLSGLLGSFIFVEKYMLNDPLQMNFSGSAILAVINLFLIGIVLSCLGLIALYIANIHREVVNRPIYTIRPMVGPRGSKIGAGSRGSVRDPAVPGQTADGSPLGHMRSRTEPATLEEEL